MADESLPTGKKRALGKGLDALIRADATLIEAEPAGVVELRTNDVSPNPYQPRHTMDAGALDELVESVRAHGIVQPIVVRRVDRRYELILGERRLRAATAAGLATVPALVRDVSDEEMLCLALVENVQREDLNPIDKAKAYKRLMDEFGLTQEAMAERVSQNRATVANTVRLLGLPQSVQVVVARGDISVGHAKALLSLDNAPQQEELCQRIVKQGLSVRATEKTVEKIRQGASVRRRERKRERNVHVEAMEEELRGVFGTRVNVVYGKGKGKIEIEYYSDDELERILSIMRGGTPF